MSSNSPMFAVSRRLTSVSTFQYPQTPPSLPELARIVDEPPSVNMTEEAFEAHLARARAEGAADAQNKMRKEFETRADREAAKVAASIRSFEEQSRQYYARVEVEVVTLALSIAAKILHRESQVDSQLVAALVQMSLKQMREGSAVLVRVCPDKVQAWREHLASARLGVVITVTEDPTLQIGDCVIESELGSANFSLESQLKEVERGFFDVLAQKPQS